MNKELFEGIINNHQDLLIDTPIEFNERSVSYTSDDAIYRTAKLACLNLGFIEKDAECLGLAWEKMVSDTGSSAPTQWPNKRNYFNFHNAVAENRFPSCDKNLGLYVVAPDANWIKFLAEQNVPTIQLRLKSSDQNLIESEIVKSIEAVKNKNCRLFINDHWKLAIKHQAYGVHLGQEDLDIADIQAIKNSGIRLGLSTHGYAEMIKADHFSPSYMALGAIFPTTLKKMETAPQGLGRLNQYAKLMNSYPLVAIGGIDELNIENALKSGVGSAAVVRAVINAKDPSQAIRILKSKFNH